MLRDTSKETGLSAISTHRRAAPERTPEHPAETVWPTTRREPPREALVGRLRLGQTRGRPAGWGTPDTRVSTLVHVAAARETEHRRDQLSGRRGTCRTLAGQR